MPVFILSQYIGENQYSVDFKEGTMTLTMVDAKTEQVIWQGWTTSEVNSRNFTQKEVNGVVKAIFRKADLAKR